MIKIVRSKLTVVNFHLLTYIDSGDGWLWKIRFKITVAVHRWPTELIHFLSFETSINVRLTRTHVFVNGNYQWVLMTLNNGNCYIKRIGLEARFGSKNGFDLVKRASFGFGEKEVHEGHARQSAAPRWRRGGGDGTAQRPVTRWKQLAHEDERYAGKTDWVWNEE